MMLSRQAMIHKALKSPGVLTFDEYFIEVGGVLSPMSTKIKDDVPIYLDADTIEYFGFGGDHMRQKKSLFRLIDKNLEDDEGVSFWRYNNAGYGEFLKTHKGYPPVPTGRGTSTTKHILVMPDTLDTLLLVANTKRSALARRNIIQTKNIVLSYFMYKCEKLSTPFAQMVKQINSHPAAAQVLREQAIARLEADLSDKSRVGCVYFVSDGEAVKIGWCWNMPRRLEILQTGNAKELKVIKTILTLDPPKLEAALHKKYADHHIRGEWFMIDEDLFA